MRNQWKIWIGLTVLLAVAQVAHGQSQKTLNTLQLDDPAVRPKASIEDLAWLAGSWQGEGLGGAVEEVWLAPSAGTMVGVFKAAREEKPFFYEIVLLVEEKGSITLKLKHFHPDLKGWEEKDEVVEFPLVALKEKEALFSGLTYRLTKADELRAYVAVERQGKTEELEFVWRRVGASG